MKVAKSETRRAAILNRLTDYVLAEGLSASSLRPLAEAAETSDRMLLYYFKNKEDLMTAILEQVVERFIPLINDDETHVQLSLDEVHRNLCNMVGDDALWPFMRLWLEAASRAAQGDLVCRAVGERIGRGFLALVESQLPNLPDREKAQTAAKLLALVEGAVFLKSIGMEDVGKAAFEGALSSAPHND